MLNRILSILILLISQFVFTQDYEFGEISKEELSERVFEKDTSANAVVLFKHQDTYFVYNSGVVQVITEIHERIKIYNKEGFGYATQTINLFKSGNSKESIGKIKAYTYNLEGQNIEKTQLDKNQIFKTEYSYNTNQVKLTMPNVKEGSVIEFKYKTTSPYIFYIDEIVLQYDIPIKRVYAELRTPEIFKFNKIQKGHLFLNSKTSTKSDNRLGMGVIVNTFEINDVPALKEESYVDNIDNYRAGVMVELIGIEIPGQVYKSYAQSWSEVASTIGSSEDYKKQLDKTNSFDDEIDILIGSTSNNLDRMKILFDFVKNKIKWNGMEGVYFYKGIKKALKERQGNSADINLTLVAMLRYAGIKANPVVISTKDNGVPLFPTIDRLNHVVAYAVINDKKYFLDATEEFVDINVMPIKNYNWRGIYIDNTNKLWKLIDLDDAEKSKGQHMLNAKISEDGSIEGKLYSRYFNHHAMQFRNNYKDVDIENFISKRESKFYDIEISNYVVEKADVVEGSVNESFDFYQEDGVELIGDDIYLTPLSFFKIEENPFKSEERLYPVDFGYLQKDQYILKYEIPEGYKVNSNIKPILVKTPDDLAEFIFSSAVIGNILQVSFSIDIKKSVVSPQNYAYLKEFFNQIVTRSSDKIILSKV